MHREFLHKINRMKLSKGVGVMFWEDVVVKVLFTLGICISVVFFGWVATLHGSLPSEILVNNNAGGQVSFQAGQLFIYPILGLMFFVGSLAFGRSVYNTNRTIAYRVIVTSHFFHLLWVILVFWAVRHS